MRYTTIIDITEYPDIYRCLSARLIYLHLVLRAGWGERNQDYIRGSIRRLEGELGLTFSAVRHGLRVLIRAGMLKQVPGGWIVRKYCQPTKPGARQLTQRQEAAAKQRARDAAEMRRLEALIDERRPSAADRAAAAAARQEIAAAVEHKIESGEYSNLRKILGPKPNDNDK